MGVPVWTLGDGLRKERKDRGLEQSDVAAMVDVSRQTISNWENNKGEPTVSQWFTLVKRLDAPWLLEPGTSIRDFGCIDVYPGQDVRDDAA